MMPKSIDFWFSIGSTYTYLSVMRVEAAASSAGIAVRWMPFSVRQIMTEQKNSPFAGKPAKMAYMWRDIERRAPLYGLTPKLPAPYPLIDLNFANRIAIVGMREGWGVEYTKAAYRMWFEEGKMAGDADHAASALRLIGQEPEAILSEARSDAIGQIYSDQTEEAKAIGLFGSPNFIVGREIFWGDDHLEDAIAWCVGSHGDKAVST